MLQKAYLLLGSNLDDRVANLEMAREQLHIRIGPEIAASSVYRTQAWGGRNKQPEFLNQSVAFSTSITPLVLLKTVVSIEIDMGRKKNKKWDSRTIDIDILLYGNIILSTPELTVPHSLMPFRRFALTPLSEIAPDTIHPVSGQTISQLLDECIDSLSVEAI